MQKRLHSHYSILPVIKVLSHLLPGLISLVNISDMTFPSSGHEGSCSWDQITGFANPNFDKRPMWTHYHFLFVQETWRIITKCNSEAGWSNPYEMRIIFQEDATMIYCHTYTFKSNRRRVLHLLLCKHVSVTQTPSGGSARALSWQDELACETVRNTKEN